MVFFLFIAPTEVLFYALTQQGIVGYVDLDQSTADMDRYLVGRSDRPVAVAYDPVEQVKTWIISWYILAYFSNLLKCLAFSRKSFGAMCTKTWFIVRLLVKKIAKFSCHPPRIPLE